jgi:hypothetical protein
MNLRRLRHAIARVVASVKPTLARADAIVSIVLVLSGVRRAAPSPL